jgi:hypothetical protein
MSSKIDFQNILDLLSMIKQKDQWELNVLIKQLNISKKDLFYLLNVLSEIQSDYDLFFDIKVNEDNQLITFEYSSFLEDFQTITDADLFNLYFLLKIDDLVIEDSYKNNVSDFISVLDDYINLDKLTKNNVPISELFSNDNLFIEYLKLGTDITTSYNIKPLTLKSNEDGIVLDALDQESLKVKSFVVSRIISVNETEIVANNISSNSSTKLEFEINEKYNRQNFKQKLNKSGNIYYYEFYSYENALSFAIENIEKISLLSPQALIKDLDNRKQFITTNIFS